MCEKCIGIDKQITTYRRFVGYSIDALTAGRLKDQLLVLEQQKKALHPDDPWGGQTS